MTCGVPGIQLNSLIRSVESRLKICAATSVSKTPEDASPAPSAALHKRRFIAAYSGHRDQQSETKVAISGLGERFSDHCSLYASKGKYYDRTNDEDIGNRHACSVSACDGCAGTRWRRRRRRRTRGWW